MSQADLLRLLDLTPYGIVALAVVAALALYELLALNPQSRAPWVEAEFRMTLSTPEPVYPSSVDRPATAARPRIAGGSIKSSCGPLGQALMERPGDSARPAPTACAKFRISAQFRWDMRRAIAGQ